VSEITIRVPKGVPLSPLKKKIDELIREEEVRWALYYKSREVLAIGREELEDLEEIRDKVWIEEKKGLSFADFNSVR